MAGALSSLGIPNFRLYFFAQAVSLTGTWLQTIALSWLVFELTGSSVLLGVVVATQFLPLLLFGLYGGHFADRYPKYASLLVIQALSIIPPLTIAATLFVNVIEIWMLVLASLAQGILRVFDHPVRQAFVSYLVPEHELKNAVSLYTIAGNVARLIGPVGAAFLLLTVGAAWSFLLNALSYAFVVMMLLLMNKAAIRTREKNEAPDEPILRKLRIIALNMPLRNSLLIAAAVGTLVFTAKVTFPVFITEVLDGNVDAYGYMFAAISAGAIVGGLYTARKSTKLAHSIGSNLILCGAAFTVLSFCTTLLAALITLAIAGFFLTAVTASINTLVRKLSDDSYLGTTMALWGMAMVGMGAVGNSFLGYLVAVLEIQPAMLLNGIMISSAGAIYLYSVMMNKSAYDG